MYRSAGDPDARDPQKKGCQCRLCSNDIDNDRLRWLQTWDETGHSPGCDCDECRRVYESGHVDVEAVRDDVGCKLAGFSSETHYWVDTYFSLIEPGYLDPTEKPLPYLQVATIGRDITATIKSETMERQSERMSRKREAAERG